MSLFQTETIACPACGAKVNFDVVYSVNADRRPDLREAILDGTFQEESCVECGKTFRMAPELSYLDVERRQWLLVQPFEQLEQWPELEQRARASFETSYGPDQAAAVQEIGKSMQARVTFGWAAFREKLLAVEHGLDDVTLELLKLAIIRGLDGTPLADDTELRLAGIEGEDLKLGWLKPADETVVEVLTVPRALYEEIAADKAVWQPLREQLSAGAYVDIYRLLVEPAAVGNRE